jgi:tetratricopeptide (TPR) repeat protein
MKLIIFIFVFNSFSIFSTDRNDRVETRKNIISGYNNKQYKEIIPLLEVYTSMYPDEILFQLYLAKSYLYFNNLSNANGINKEDIFKFRNYYSKSVVLFSKIVPMIEEKTPLDKKLGDYYFYWGLADMFSGRDDLAIRKFTKSSRINPSIKENYYNLAIINEKLSNTKESDRYFLLYNKLNEPEKEKSIEK